MRVKTITCPNCGHANNFLAEECTQCGINFSRYYEELEKAESLRRHLQEREKAEALGQGPEEKESRKTPALPSRPDEQAHREAEEQLPGEAEKRPETEGLPETPKRAAMLKRQQEALEKAEARQPHEEKDDPQRPGEENPPGEKTARSTADEKAPSEDEADAFEIEELDPADIEEHAGAFDFIEYPADEPSDAGQPDIPDRPDFPLSDYPPAASLEERLRTYEGRMLGVTYGDPAEIQNVKLLAVSRDHFQVFYPISRHVVSFPYGAIVSITENAKGVSAVGPDISPVFPMVVELPRPFFHAE